MEATQFDYDETLALLEYLEDEWSGNPLRLDEKKHAIQAWDDAGELTLDLRLPLVMPAMEEDQSLSAYRESLSEDIPTYLMFIVQLGAASVGAFEDGEVVDHKAFKKYMKREKRGKAQISYLNQKGKSKAGSRIRLANTVRFFEELNERLTDLMEWYEPERLIYSCTAQLWGLMYQSKVPPPFEKKDPRLIKVPLDLKVPTHEEMMRVNEFAQKSRLLVYPEDEWDFQG
ncbi:hypothetical protein [Pontibacter sp. G13]|uniref:hypothetical protein n=1 Tax=Pontibacter sp. G13 TaxID=3074898 RepID=UPI00288B8BC7|nr:hypothetical protein [Pontibacter sp. G13]WNJ16509.1 hypothetical protein RJD25_16710 [Pontibacter sp. G13]